MLTAQRNGGGPAIWEMAVLYMVEELSLSTVKSFCHSSDSAVVTHFQDAFFAFVNTLFGALT